MPNSGLLSKGYTKQGVYDEKVVSGLFIDLFFLCKC